MRFQKVLTSLTRVGCYQHSSLYNRLTVTVITALVTGPPRFNYVFDDYKKHQLIQILRYLWEKRQTQDKLCGSNFKF